MKTSPAERRKIVDKAHRKLRIKRQCELLSIPRSGYYYHLGEKKEDTLNLELMKLIDQHYLEHPYMGVPSMTQWLSKDMGFNVNHKRIARLYRLMDLSAIVPGPHTSKGCKEHKKYPYLLRNLVVDHVNQVWGIDITYIPIKNGYMYLVAIIDLYSRFVVGWSLSNTMEAVWVVETVKEAIGQYGRPEIINSDQGSQFTGDLYTGFLISEGITISMDGRGRATDNIFIERLWRSLKYEDIYLNAYETGTELFSGLRRYFQYYNQERRHSSLAYQIPEKVFNAA
jgi:putative transposase